MPDTQYHQSHGMGGFERKSGGVLIPPLRDRHRDHDRDPLARNSVPLARPEPTMPDKAPPAPTPDQPQEQIAATGAVLERARDSAQTGLDLARDALSHKRNVTEHPRAGFLSAVNQTATRLDSTRPPAQCQPRLCDMAEQTSARAHQLLELSYSHGLKSRFLERLRRAVLAFDASWARARATAAQSRPAHQSASADDRLGRAHWLLGGPARTSQSSTGPSAGKATGPVQRTPQAAASSIELDAAVQRIVERIDGITGDAEEQEILTILRDLSPAQYSQVMARLNQRNDGSDTYLARLHQDLHGEELHTWLALDRAKRLAARAGRPHRMEATLAALEAGQDVDTFDYAPSHLTAPSTWNYRSYPEDASYRDGHIGLYWRTHQNWYDVAGARTGHTLALDRFIRINNRVTGTTEVLSAAQVVALSDDHRSSAQFAKLTVLTLAMGGVLVGASRTLLGKFATGLFEIVLPAVGQYVADHEHQIAHLRGGRAFLHAWQMFNLSMAGFGVARLAWGPGRAVVHRLRHSADQLAQTNPGHPIAATAAEHVRSLDDAVTDVSGAARVVGLSADQAQATRLLDALGDAGMDAGRLAALSEDTVTTLRNADTAMSSGQLQRALRHLDEAGLSASEREAMEESLTAVHGGLMTDALTAAGKPTPALSNRMPEHKISRQRGGFSDAANAKKNVRARRRELEAQYGKGYMNDISDAEIHAERLYRGDRRNKEITLGEPRASQGLGMEHKVGREQRSMVDILVEERHGRLVPIEVKNQTSPELVGSRNAAVHKFREIVDNAPKEILDRIDHFELIVHRDSIMPRNFKATAQGELWHLVDGTSNPPVWKRWEFAGKPVIIRRGDLGEISR